MKTLPWHALPRFALGHWPTPLEPLPRLSAELGGPQIWLKRDDCSGLATGGNKTRKLEYLLAVDQRFGTFFDTNNVARVIELYRIRQVRYLV